MKIEDLILILEAVAVPEKVPDMEAYMKAHFKFLGVQKPALRKIEKEFFKGHLGKTVDWNFVEACWIQPPSGIPVCSHGLSKSSEKAIETRRFSKTETVSPDQALVG